MKGSFKKQPAVPLVPRLTVTMPSRTLPVPIAPYMLSPEPASTLHSGENPKRSTSSDEIVPMDRSEGRTSGNLSRSFGSIASMDDLGPLPGGGIP